MYVVGIDGAPRAFAAVGLQAHEKRVGDSATILDWTLIEKPYSKAEGKLTPRNVADLALKHFNATRKLVETTLSLKPTDVHFGMEWCHVGPKTRKKTLIHLAGYHFILYDLLCLYAGKDSVHLYLPTTHFGWSMREIGIPFLGMEKKYTGQRFGKKTARELAINLFNARTRSRSNQGLALRFQSLVAATKANRDPFSHVADATSVALTTAGNWFKEDKV